jgi:diguanylate cyclase (GGDEF)-like protein
LPTLQPSPTVPAPGGRGGSGLLVLVALAGAATVGAVAFFGLRNRAQITAGHATGALAPAAARTAPPTSAVPGALTHELLEVSRQLTAASVTGDVKRATVRGALNLVPADGAALLTVDAETGDLAIAVESTPDLLVPDQLRAGVLGRVADTGDYVELISASEPAIRNRPACVLAMPLVATGRVAAVLVVVRAKDQPFTPNETKTLRALAPMAAAVLQSERHAQSAIEDSLIDPLTGANNRRRFDRDLTAVLQRTTANTPASLAIVDLDHFKRVNDTHGHPAGDALLKAVVATVQQAVRPGDGVYRFGGEEFCVLFTATTAPEALDVAERVRAAIAAQPFDVGAAEPLPATASIGVATTSATTKDAGDLLARADAALYTAKEGGRNQVVAG